MTTIAALDKQIAQLKARKELLVTKKSKTDRNLAARRKIVIGGWVLANDPALVEIIKLDLTRDQDRAAFGLTVEKKTLLVAERFD